MKTLAGLAEALRGLDGEPLKEGDAKIITLGSILANTLARGHARQPARAMDLALKLYNYPEDEIALEDGDFAMLKEAIAGDQFLSNMAKTACLKLFEIDTSSPSPDAP